MKHTLTTPTLPSAKVLLITLGLAINMSSTYAQTDSTNWTGSVSGFIGDIQVNDSISTNQDSQGSTGLMINFGRKHWPVQLVIDLIGAGNEQKIQAREDEFYKAAMHLGARKPLTITHKNWDAYIGGGIALAYLELNQKPTATAVTTQKEDSGRGYWLGTGASYKLGEHLQIGADIRYSSVDVNLENKTQDLGGIQTAFTLGYHF